MTCCDTPPAPTTSDAAARRRATLVGATAILLWATFATLIRAAGPIPSVQLLAVTFTLAFLVWAARWLWRGESIVGHLRLPWRVWLLGVAGFFGNLLLYVVAMQGPPAAQAHANLINYLWPLEIVLLSAALPGHRLRWWHAGGVLLGFAGAAVLVLAPGGGGVGGARVEFFPAYLAAFFAGLCWAVYSVLSRRIAHVPTDSVGAFCGGTALLSWACHLGFDRATVWPSGALAWAAVVAMGLGPICVAYMVWDIGVKRGHIQALGAASYATPLLSTGLLMLAGYAPPSVGLAVACALVVGGAVLASWDVVFGAASQSLEDRE